MPHKNVSHAIEPPSERSFGLVFTVVFLAITFWPVAFGEGGYLGWALVGALGLAAITYLRPQLLARPNLLWFRFGLLLGSIVSPIVLGILFFAVMTPIGLLVRLLGKDLLSQRLNPSAASYWIPRSNDMGSMKDQF